jgi:pimeloyl-ACP methyl ester carboxylesterase
MGGYITLAFAEKYPQFLKAFGLFHSSSYPDSEEKKEARRKSIDLIRQYGSAKFIEQSTPNLFSENFKKKHPDIVQELVARYTNFSATALVQYYEAMMQRPDRTEILQKFEGPILFIMGKHDNAIPLEHSLQQCHLPDLSYTLILENSGHMGMLEEAEKSSPFIEKFLTEIEIAKPYQRYS